jgi:uncharacterized protein involved in exopolysaccharide biosynthesis
MDSNRFISNTPPDYLQVLIKRRRWIGQVVGIALLVALIVSFLLPTQYESVASILPPLQEASFSSVFINPAQIHSGVDASTGGLLMGKESAAELWVGMLNSRTAQESVVRDQDLMRVFDVKTMDHAVRLLRQRVRISKSKNDIISITVRDTDPARAAAVANAYIGALNTLNRNIVLTTSRRVRIFVEKRLLEAQATLLRIEGELQDFKNRHRAVHLDEQSEAIIDTVGKVKGALLVKEVELTALLSYATPYHPQVSLLRSEIGELKRALTRLETDQKGPKSVFISTSLLPDISVAYARLTRDLKTQENLYDFLSNQYEMAKIQEAKDSVSVQTLDVAYPAQEATSPKRGLLLLTVALAAIFCAILVSLFVERARREVRPAHSSLQV